MFGTQDLATDSHVSNAIENLAAMLGQIDAYLSDPAIRAQTQAEALAELQALDDRGDLPQGKARMLYRIADGT